ncbi:MAG: hypothetical protein ACP5HG_16175 [Anaerolineae bacterium]
MVDEAALAGLLGAPWVTLGGWLVAIAMAVAAVLAVVAWRRDAGPAAARIHLALVVATGVAFVLYAAYWRLFL